MNTYSETTIVTRDLCASGTDVPRALTAEPQTGKVGNDQPCTSTEIIARGRASLAHIERGHWPDWRNVIAALAAGRTIALLQAGTNVPQGGRYREAMGRWLRCHGFDRIDKADRSRLLKVADNLTAIDEWRNGLPPDEQLRLNHPRTVLATWNATQRQSSPPPPPPPPPAGANARDDVGPESLGEIARMRARNEELEAETARIARTNLTLGNEIDELKSKIATLARKLTALTQHPEQHVEAIRKAAAEVLRLVGPELRKPTAAPPAIGDQTTASLSTSVAISSPKSECRPELKRSS